MLQHVNLVGDFAERGADQTQHADVFRKTVARRLPVDVRHAEAEALHQPLLEFLGLRSVRCLGADGAHHAADKHARFELAQALVMPSHFGQPDSGLVPEGNRQRLHAVRAPHHRCIAVFFGQAVEFTPNCLDVAQVRGMRIFDLQNRTGVEHVLRRRPEMDELAVFGFA